MLHFISRVLTLAFLAALVSCSAGKQAVKVGFDIRIEGAATTHPVMLFAQEVSTGRRISKTFPSGSTELAASFPNGVWNFSFIVWDGATPLEGTAKCFETTQTLTGAATVVNVALAVANCSAAVFGGGNYYDASNGLRRIDFHHCGSLDAVVDETSTCEHVDRGFHRSYKIGLLQMDETLGPSTSVGLESQCIVADGLVAENTTGLRLPGGSAAGPFKFLFKAFESNDCSGDPATQIADHTLVTDLTEVYTAGTNVEVFVKSEGPIKNVKLREEAGSGCDAGVRPFGPVKLSTSAGDDLYIFSSVSSGSGQYHLFMNINLNASTSLPVVDTSLNSVGDEKPKSLVKIGNKAYFNVQSDIGHSYRLFSYDEFGAVLIGPTIMVEGTDSANTAGVVSKLIPFGTKLFFSFRNDPAAATELCFYDTLSTLTDCTITDVTVDKADPFLASSQGVFYFGEDLADSSKFKIFHMDATTNVHTIIADLSSATTNVNSITTYSNGGHDYLQLTGSPTSSLLHWTDTTMSLLLTDMAFNAKGLEYGSDMVFVSAGVPHVVNGSTVNSLETLASITMNTGGSTLSTSVLSTNGEYLYFNSDRGISGSQTNLHVYSNSTNILTQVTSYSPGDNIWSIPSAILGSDLFYFGSDGTGTVMYKLTGTTSTAIRTINGATKNTVLNPYVFNGNLYFSADDGVVGYEPWVSNGFAAGTGLLMNITPGLTGSFPSFRGVVGDYLLISTTNGLYRTKGPAGPTTIHFALPNMEYMNGSQFYENTPLANLTSWGLSKRYVVWIKETNP